MREVCLSVKSLRRYTDDPVTVIATPPSVSVSWCRAMDELDVDVRHRAENLTEPFRIREGKREGRYGEKLRSLMEGEEDDVLFLDGDTKINRDPAELFHGDWEFSARIAPGFLNMDVTVWRKVFEKEGAGMLPMFNTGAMAFRRGAAKKIGRQALDYFREGEQVFPHDINPQYLLDQFAVSLAVAKQDIVVHYMGKREHGFRWLHENPSDPVIYHGSARSPLHEVLRGVRGLCWYVS